MAAQHVLVISNNPAIREFFTSLFGSLGLSFSFASDVSEGRKKKTLIKPDLVFFDATGADVVTHLAMRAFSESNPTDSPPIVLITRKGDMVGERLVHTLGIVDYLTTPLTRDAVETLTLHLIEDAHAFQTPIEPAFAEEQLAASPLEPADLSDERGVPSFRGNLGMISISEVFELLKYQSHSGILHLAKGSVHLEVFVQKGTVHFARAKQVDDEFLLGRFLLEVGAMEAKELELFLKNRSGTQKLMGEQLVKLGYIKPEQLTTALSRQTEALMYEAVRWLEGEFAFFSTDSLPIRPEEAAVPLPIDKILLEGFRRVDEWGRIEKEIESFDMVLARSRDSTGVLKRVKLEPEEESIYALTDGRRTVREIIRESHRSSFDTCSILFRLLSSRIIRKRSVLSFVEES
jgi:CheY-like chemotaxis protein